LGLNCVGDKLYVRFPGPSELNWRVVAVLEEFIVIDLSERFRIVCKMN